MIFLLMTLTGCNSKDNDATSRSEFALNTICDIRIETIKSGGKDINILLDKSFDLVRYYENLLSKTVISSDISRINDSNCEWTEVDDETILLIRETLVASEKTNGVFDISIGAISQLWDFKNVDNPQLPNSQKLDMALKSVDYRSIHIKKNKVKLDDPNTKLDLGAIAKGYIADKVISMLVDEGVSSGIVNLGGNMSVIGVKPNGEEWNIGIELPYSDRKEIIGSTKIKDKTIVTSGVYERYFEINEKKYHHILDVKTGYPKDVDLLSVSIMSDYQNSMKCDLYSTTCLLLGSKGAKVFMEDKKDFEYLMVLSDGNIIESSGFGFKKIDN